MAGVDPRTAYLSTTRGARTKPGAPRVAGVPGPVGPSSTTAHGQGLALMAQDKALQGMAQSAPQGVDFDPEGAKAAYRIGGFDAVKQQPDWYDIPEATRTQILANLSGG